MKAFLKKINNKRSFAGKNFGATITALGGTNLSDAIDSNQVTNVLEQ